MNQPRFFNSLSVSFFLHTVFITAIILVVPAHRHRQITPYIVAIVEDAPIQPPAPEKLLPEQEPVAPQPMQESQKKEPIKKLPPIEKSTQKSDLSRVQERIDALKAKKHIERLVNLRRSIDIKASGTAPSALHSKDSTSSQGMPAAEYESLVGSLIRQKWNYPATLDQNLEAVVVISIALDGQISIQEFEKKSGSTLFDRSVIRAITLSSPLPRPEKVTELGIKFIP